MLLISHDLRVLAGICSEIAVMAEGRIVQRETTERLIGFPTHPASIELVEAVFPPLEKNRERASNGI
jgi:oligopeptide transport system ATP-binding protein